MSFSLKSPKDLKASNFFKELKFIALIVRFDSTKLNRC